MTTFLSPTWTFSLNSTSTIQTARWTHLVLNFAASPLTQLLYNWIHHFFSFLPSTFVVLPSDFCTPIIVSSFSQEPKFNMRIILDSSFSLLFHISSVTKVFSSFLQNFSPATGSENRDNHKIIYPLLCECTLTLLAQGRHWWIFPCSITFVPFEW